MEDTEARAAIGWVRWLQALGARPIESAVADGSASPEDAAAASNVQAREALREMFAELDPAGRAPRVVEGELAQPGAAREDGHGLAPEIQSVGTHGFVFGQPGAAPAGDATSGQAESDVTVEELERRFASSTLERFTSPPRGESARSDEPPSVAEHAVEGAARITGGPVSSPDDFGEPDSAPAAVAVGPADATPSPAASARAAEADETPAPDDYMGRLRLARRRRASGRIEDALMEYRSLLRDSTDSLDDLIHDLRDMSGETDNSEIHRLLGDAYIREGNYLNALEAYNRALALSQDASH